MGFFKSDAFARKEVLSGITVGSVHLDDLMLTHFTFKAGAVVPEHSHSHQQITFLVRGEMEFTLEGETRLIRAGEGCAVPPNAKHGVRAMTEAEAIDCWHPIREDYIVGGTGT
jgi:quercetin dioxygenase-like cupin family protein